MFCPKCGAETNSNFCPHCGTNLQEFADVTPVLQSIPPLKEPYIQTINGKAIDLNRVIRMYGTGIRKIGAYAYLQTETGVTHETAQKVLDPIFAAHGNEKASFFEGFSAQAKVTPIDKETWRREENEFDAAGKVYCPKCHSLDVTAQKKGFGAIKGTAGAVLTGKLSVGAVVGAVGSNKVLLTCMKCGHQWKPGHK